MRVALCFMIFLLWGNTLMAQTQYIRGYVYDTAKNPLIGATVQEIGTENTVTTDFDGFFELRLVRPRKKVKLQVSYVGYKTQTVKVKPKKGQAEIILEEAAVLNDVVVTERKKDKGKKKETISVWGEADELGRAPSLDAEEIPMTSSPTSLDHGAIGGVKVVEESFDDYGEIYDEEATMTTLGTVTDESPAAGQLTAGILNDYGKWELWQDIQENELKEWQDTWVIAPKERYPIQLTTANGYPIVDAVVQLMDDGSPVWSARTDNLGRAELWANLYQEGKLGTYSLQVTYQNQEYDIPDVKAFHAGGNHQVLQVQCDIPEVVDIALVVDATGSMGDEINYLKSELKDVISRSKKELDGVELRLGSVFYRDLGDSYVTRKSHFSTDIQKTVNFIDKQGAAGGGDAPEAVEEALDEALGELVWSESATARLLFLVLDAPPHENDAIQERIREQIEEAARRGIRIIPVACSGTGRSTEYLMRSIALATNGSYIYLTDDSGIGGSHLDPVTDEVKVDLLNDLLVKTITDFAIAPRCDEPLQYANANLKDTMEVTSSFIPTGGNAVDVAWKYYPNPCLGQLQVEVEANVEYLYLLNSAGKLLQRIPLAAVRTTIDLRQYPSGVYYLKVQLKDGKEDISGKVILLHSS